MYFLDMRVVDNWYPVLGDCTEVSSRHCFSRPQSVPRNCAYGHQTLSAMFTYTYRSAANDYWGKVFLKLTGEKKMNQQLAILTGSSAGATESFVVVPLELVKIKCALALPAHIIDCG